MVNRALNPKLTAYAFMVDVGKVMQFSQGFTDEEYGRLFKGLINYYLTYDPETGIGEVMDDTRNVERCFDNLLDCVNEGLRSAQQRSEICRKAAASRKPRRKEASQSNEEENIPTDEESSPVEENPPIAQKDEEAKPKARQTKNIEQADLPF